MLSPYVEALLLLFKLPAPESLPKTTSVCSMEEYNQAAYQQSKRKHGVKNKAAMSSTSAKALLLFFKSLFLFADLAFCLAGCLHDPSRAGLQEGAGEDF